MANGNGEGGGFDPKLFLLMALQGIANPRGGAVAQSTLLNTFLRREQMQKQMQQIKEAEKQNDTMLDVEMANLTQTLNQGGDLSQPQGDFMTGLVQGGFADANVPTQEAKRSTTPQAVASQAQRAQIAEEDRVLKKNEQIAAAQLKKDQKRFRNTGFRTLGLRGKDLEDYVDLLTAPYPNEQARQIALQQRFPDMGETELDRITEDLRRSQLEAARLNVGILKSELKTAKLTEQELVRQAQRLASISGRYAGPSGIAVLQADLDVYERILKAVPQEMDDFTLPQAAKRAGVTEAEMIGAAMPLGMTPLGDMTVQQLDGHLASSGNLDTWLIQMESQGLLSNLATARLEARGIYDPANPPKEGSQEEAELLQDFDKEIRAIRNAARYHVIGNREFILQPALPGPVGRGGSTRQQPAQAPQEPGTSVPPESTTGVVAPTEAEVKELRTERQRLTKEIASNRNQIARFERQRTQPGGQNIASHVSELKAENEEKQAEIVKITERINEYIKKPFDPGSIPVPTNPLMVR